MAEILIPFQTRAIVHCEELEMPYQPPIDIGSKVIIHQVGKNGTMHGPKPGMITACTASRTDMCDRTCHNTGVVVNVEKGTSHGRAGIITIRPDNVRSADDFPEIEQRVTRVGSQYTLGL